MNTGSKKILIFGAGVIGSTFGGLLSMAGHEVTILARNKRLAELQEKGLLLQTAKAKMPVKADAKIISKLSQNDVYDFVVVALRKDQVNQALNVLAENQSKNFIFMVNNPSGYSDWINALGADRVIPAFPGSGGKIENGAVHYEIVSKFIQPTTIGEMNGQVSERILQIKNIFSKAGFPVSISRNMDAWQKTHVAMVGPLGDVIYFDGGNNYTVAKNPEAIKLMNRSLAENFSFLHQSGIGIEPVKLNIFRILPQWVLNRVMKHIFNSKWAETVISNHALNARDEMRLISGEFLALAKSKGFELKHFRKIVDTI